MEQAAKGSSEALTDAQTEADVAVILTVLRGKPLDYARGVLRRAIFAAESASVVSPES